MEIEIMNENQFDALAQVSRLRAGSDKYAALHQILVKGLSVGDAARRVGIPYRSAWNALDAAKVNIDLCKRVASPFKQV